MVESDYPQRLYAGTKGMKFLWRLAITCWSDSPRPTRAMLMFLAYIEAYFLIFGYPSFVKPTTLLTFSTSTWGWGWLLYAVIETMCFLTHMPRFLKYAGRILCVLLCVGWASLLWQASGFPVAWTALGFAAVWSLARVNVNEP